MTALISSSATQYHVWHAFSNGQCEQFPDIVRGEGDFVYDESGREYVNGFSGLVLPLGLGHPELRAAIMQQLDVLPYASLFRLRSTVTAELASRLSRLAPGDLQHVLFTVSGSEAVEAAMKIARQHAFITGRPEKKVIVSFQRSYHGTGFGAFSVSGIYDRSTQEAYGPLLPDVAIVPGSCEGTEPCAGAAYGCDGRCAAPLERTLRDLGPERVAAVIAEPIQAAGGVHVPGRAFLDRVSAACRAADALLIADEAATGFGRTGRMFACEHFDVVPDIMVVAKALTGGYVPLGAVLVAGHVHAAFSAAGADGVVHHGASQSAAPLAVAAALKTLDVIERDRLVTRTEELGTELAERLGHLCDHRIVAAVRTFGLLSAIDLANPHASGRPLPPEVATRVHRQLVDCGLLTHVKANRLALFLPLTVREETIDLVVARLSEALTATSDTR